METDALELLEALCREPSVSAEGSALESTADLVAALLDQAGFETKLLRVDGSPPAVYGEQRGRSDYTLLLYNHYDVQPVDPIDLWESPPFEPTVQDGKLFARGAADNKGEIAVRLAAFKALRERHGELPITIRWIIEGEEEVLSPHFDEIVRTNAGLLRADASLWEGAAARLSDGRPALVLGFKGALAVRLDVRILKSDVHSGSAATVPSAAWRLVQALTSLRGPDGRIRLPGYYDPVRSPTHAERRAIEEQGDAMEKDMLELLGIDEFLDGLTGAPLRERGSFSPTANIAGIKTGYSGPGMKTVLPAEASAWMDFRLVPDQRADDVLAALKAHFGEGGFDDVEVTVLGSAEAAGTSIEHPFVQEVARVAEEVTGEPPSIIPRVGGTLPIVFTFQQHLNVPGVAAPGNPIYAGSRAHAPNENVQLEDIAAATRFTYALIEALG